LPKGATGTKEKLAADSVRGVCLPILAHAKPEGEHLLVPAPARHLNTESTTFSGINRLQSQLKADIRVAIKTKSGINFMRGMKPQ
jgi:hypothetical protein